MGRWGLGQNHRNMKAVGKSGDTGDERLSDTCCKSRQEKKKSMERNMPRGRWKVNPRHPPNTHPHRGPEGMEMAIREEALGRRMREGAEEEAIASRLTTVWSRGREPPPAPLATTPHLPIATPRRGGEGAEGGGAERAASRSCQYGATEQGKRKRWWEGGEHRAAVGRGRGAGGSCWSF